MNVADILRKMNNKDWEKFKGVMEELVEDGEISTAVSGYIGDMVIEVTRGDREFGESGLINVPKDKYENDYKKAVKEIVGNMYN